MNKKNLTLMLLSCLLLLACGGGKVDPTPDPAPDPVLPVPSGVRVTASGENSLSFSWDAAAGADSYACRLLNGMTLIKNETVNTTSCTITGLEPATTYRFAVKSLSGSNESAFSSYLEASTARKEPVGPEYPDPIGTPAQVLEAMQIPASEGSDALAFPGAEGCGKLTTGGRGGKVIHVTNLKDNGEGSLRAALSEKGPRTIVFDVAGIIDLKSRLEIKNGDVTIAGQTAPGAGICLRGYNLRINASNVIIRFIRCRMGDATATEDDAMNCYTGSTPGFSNIIIDHCSMSWSTDECASFYGVNGFTLQYCIIAESLRISVHGKGNHGYAGLWGGADASYHHNLLAHHDSRNPRFSHDYLNSEKGPIHFYNNVVFNWGGNSAYGGEGGPGQEPRRINFVANYYKPGPASSHAARLVNPTTKCSNCNSADKNAVTPGKFYVADNYMYGSSAVTEDNWKGVEPDDPGLLEAVKASSWQGEKPSRIQTAEEAFRTVLKYSGASLRRDRVDERIAGETESGKTTYTGSKGNTKGIIDTQEDVGGWPAYEATQKELEEVVDSDSDGIPDWYEALLGLDMKDRSDAAAYSIDSSLKRYSNLELYLHYLVRGIVTGQTDNN